MKKKKITLLYFVLLTALPVFSQVKGDYVWPLGYEDYDGPGDEYSGMLLDFNQTPPAITQHSLLFEPLAFIGDSTGNLVLYTNGCRIKNGLHEVIENGDSLNAGFWFGNACGVASYPNYQGNLFLQQPSHPQRYYLFHLKFDDDSFLKNLLYTVIDMSENDGAGKVLEKNQLLQYEQFVPYVTATRHGNGRDWWIVVPRWLTNGYTLLLLTPEGIQGPFFQEIGEVGPPLAFCCGQTAFSADGSKYFKFLPKSGLQILDFDRCSGTFSNPLFIPYGADTVGLGGVVGSPNSRYLYLSTGNYMYQYDLQSSDIPGSRQTVGVFDGYADPFYARFYQGARGPDGKLYFISSSGVKVMHVMHHPDEPGTACDFEQHGIHLPANQSFFMPNFANYRLYDLPGSACDTLGIDGPVVGAAEAVAEQAGGLHVAPNPNTGIFTLSVPGGTKDATLQVFNASGAVVLERRLYSDAAVSLDLSRYPAGLYAVLVQDGKTGKRRVGRVLVVR